jgi:response regulator RpfG family c-di-GMP phosphodiesterase
MQTIIALDDDNRTLRQISELLSQHFNILTTSDPQKALSCLENDKSVSSILVEQSLRNGAALEVLENAARLRPGVLRILITRYADLPSIVKGLHTGTIHRLISKPLIPAELSAVVAVAEARPAPASARPAAG